MEHSQADKEIVIVGIVKDISKSFRQDLQTINSAFSDFKRIRWFLVESNSSDDTLDVLAQTKKDDANIDFVSLGKTEMSGISRTIPMSEARNRYLEELLSNPKYAQSSYMVVADLNGSNNKLNLKSIRSCFQRDDWDVCTANQAGPYYDIWALRHEVWQPNDCWRQLEFYKRYVRFPEKALFMAIHSKMLTIPRNSEWIEVDSAFGGLGIYKFSAVARARYIGLDGNGKSICEHVTFHATLKSQGLRIFINPGLINTGYNDHTRRKTWLAALSRVTTYPVKFLKKDFRSLHNESNGNETL